MTDAAIPPPGARKADARAVLPRRDPLRPRGGPVRASRRGKWRAASLIAVHVVILVHLAHWWITGSTLSPVEPSDAKETLELGYVNAGFVLFVALILLTLVLGRFFCGWACHLVAYQDLCAWVLKKLGMRPRPVRSRLLILVPFGIAFYMFYWQTKEAWEARGGAPAELAMELTRDDFWRTFPGLWIALLTLLVDGFLIVYWLGAKGFCTYGCPYGAFFSIADRAAPGRIRVTDDCNTCGHCTATCSSNVRVHEDVAKYRMVVDSGCMKCMDCVSVCPKDALYYGFGKPSLLAGFGAKWRSRRADFTWGEELVLAGTFLAAVFALRGLYSYVSVLLAVGLAVLTAVFGLTAWRLLRQADLTVQSRALKEARRLTPVGRWALAGIAVWFLFVAHGGVVNWLTWSGKEAVAAVSAERAAARIRGTSRLSPAEQAEQTEMLTDGAVRLQRARALGLFGDPELEWALSQAKFALVPLRPADRAALEAEAEGHLSAAVALEPGWPEPALALASRHAAAQRFDESEAVLRDLLEWKPQLALARARIVHLGAIRAERDGDLPEAERIYQALLQEQPDYAPARINLERIRAGRER